ncbi:MAG: hypothetical protein ABI744_07600 [Chloroflexota bacterium]
MATTKTAKTAKSALSDSEKTALKETVRERKAEEKRGVNREAGLKDLLAKMAQMPQSDRVIAERIHAVVSKVAPELWPKTWYGMPAWASDGKVVCFFKAADKFKTRYATFGFEEDARIDDGTMWATSWGITKLSAADEAKLAALVKKAVG